MYEKGLKRFENKVVLIVGGGGGMGTATSKRFAEEGAQVVVCDFKAERAIEVADEITKDGGKAIALPCNTGVEEDVDKLIATIVEKFGRLDCAANMHGGNPTTPNVIDTTLENFINVVNAFLISFFLCMRAEARQMVKQGFGSIVSISSINSYQFTPSLSAYSACKAAIDALAKTLAMEVGPLGVRVNTVQPGFTKTPPNGFTRDPKYVPAVLFRTPTRRITLPEEIAAACAFLSSDDAYNITAVGLPVDGGESMEGYPDVYKIRAGVPLTYEGPELGR